MSRLLPLVILAILPLAACTRPALATLTTHDPFTGLDGATGPPHALVMVTGTNLAFSSVVWDAGMPGETTIPGGFMGAYMFSVPPGATSGTHNVAVENSSGRSVSTTFTVMDPVTPFPQPRIDYVTLIGTQFDTPDHVTAGLYVQGANFDVGAVVQIGVTEVVGGNEVTTFTDVATFSHKGLSTDWYGVPETEMAYPIRHYLSTVALPGVQPAGATLKLRVRNLDGQTSKEEFPYILPADAAHVDSDGDGLLDSWETNGYDADHDGTVDVNLPALGTDPYRRDILLELDIMDNLRYRPGPEVFDGARALFRSAPILNPFSDSGINLILDTSGKPCLRNPEGVDVCSFQEVVFDTQFMLPFIGNTQGEDPFGRGSVRFSELKRHNFDNAKRDQIFHYGIWGINLSFGVSGMSDFADDFVVTMDGDAFGASYQTNRSRVEELTHELGHDLRQLHGGTDNQAYKPTYLSVMSYIWDLRTSWWDRKIDQPDNKRRVARPTCLPFYYASRGADEVGGAVPPTVNGVKTADYTVVDYSEGMGKAIDRPVSPPGGPRGPLPKICGKDVTWENLPLDPATIRIEDFPNWRDLKFDGPGLNGWPDMDGILP